MRVLWFTNIPSGYIGGYNSGGWIVSLEKEFKKISNIQLGISFIYYNAHIFKDVVDNISYYPVNPGNNLKQKILYKYIKSKDIEQIFVKKYLTIIDDFNPDIIHIFGSEQDFGLISSHTTIPVIIHIQGILNPYFNAFLPPHYSKRDYIIKDGYNPVRCFINWNNWRLWKYAIKREKTILQSCKYFMGRTEWDRRIVKLYAPDAKYFHCDEMLRNSFLNSQVWQVKYGKKFVIVTTISSPLYKGQDMILKTARILKEILHLNVEWKVFGISQMKYAEKKNHISAKEVNVYPSGQIAEIQLQKELVKCDLFVHPSYIDNSPNSVCEAQLIGVPVLACNVGGISSLVQHLKNGILVPSNDPYTMASYIMELFNNKELMMNISKNAREIAKKRHNPHAIINNLMNIYNFIKHDTN
jgi:glycosyltransferase involved in cell wall biosynthesis